MLQSKAGYIDARPHIRPLDEVLLQCTAGPYIWVTSRQSVLLGLCPLYPRKRTNGRRLDLSALCQKRTLRRPQFDHLVGAKQG